jgi:glycosyltransferase involved in cell wall biosynthesis
MPTPSEQLTPSTPVKVSIIVCTYNRAELLRDSVESLTHLHRNADLTFEILIVNNASSDNTEAVARELCERFATIPVRYVFAAKPGVSAARNHGIAAARGEWIAFMDDDQVADPGWLSELLQVATRRDVRCVGGANKLHLPSGQEGRQLAASVQTLLGAAPSLTVEAPYSRKIAPGAGNLLVHHTVFAEIGTFDESLTTAGEDLDLYRRMWSRGIRAWCAPNALTFHVIPAYRLEANYLRWKCYRNGGHLARRDFCDKGRLRLILNALLRTGQAIWVHLPRALGARITQDAEQLLGAQCLRWKAFGYVRHAAHYAAPRMFAQQRFLNWMDFRSDGNAGTSVTALVAAKGA